MAWNKLTLPFAYTKNALMLSVITILFVVFLITCLLILQIMLA